MRPSTKPSGCALVTSSRNGLCCPWIHPRTYSACYHSTSPLDGCQSCASCPHKFLWTFWVDAVATLQWLMVDRPGTASSARLTRFPKTHLGILYWNCLLYTSPSPRD